MGKFVVHGILIEEPRRSTTTNGIDCATLLVEEKVRTPYNKEIVNVYSVDFMGKSVNCIPEGSLFGCPVVVTGSIRSREYKGKYYNDLSGDGLTVIGAGTFSNAKQAPVHEAEEPAIVESQHLDDIEIQDDDLPF